MKKIATTMILFSILLISIVGSVCIPAFETGMEECTGFSCVNESLPQHLSERSSFFLFLPISAVFFSMLAVVVFYHRAQAGNELIFFQIRQNQKRFHTKLFNFVTELFSGGILHAKIPALS